MDEPVRDEPPPRRAGSILALASASVVAVGFFAAMCSLLGVLVLGDTRYVPWAGAFGAIALLAALSMLAGALWSARTAGGSAS